ncbi:type II secretion system F family protein [Sedimentibacter sp.]|uniref:type II secretion system F family protein n=1 Tax=Sedimentibacter sp. TaxID=1960295 RepID=UPI0028AB162E|nr:type II secretion system F family protein [Sedimentibacter sp.]
MENTSIKKLSSSELSYFCSQIAMVLKSGILIADGIEWMYNDMEQGNIKNVLKLLKDNLSNKIPLYKAMESTKCFPSYIVNMSQIGSVTGRLDDVMNSLSDYYERENFLKGKIKSSIFYPTLLFAMMSFVIALLVTKIFPIFENMINELGGESIGQVSFLMSFSTGILIGRFTLILVIIILLLIVFIYILNKTENGKSTIRKFLNDFIFTKSIMKKITAYRFSSALSLLLSSGMHIDKSIDILLDVVEDPLLKHNIKACCTSMSKGESFIDSISKLSLFSSMHVQMLNMGQRTGEMDVVMKKLTNIYENEADRSISNAVSLIEPVLVGTLCVVIGFILISVMLPLMNIMSSIG